MEEQDEFEPLIIRGAKSGLPGPEHRVAIATQTVRAVEFACKHKLKYIIACTIMSPSIGGLSMATSLAMDDTDYIKNLDGCLSVLEEVEEYELCAKLIELKQLVPTVNFTRKQLKKDILNIISEL